MHSKKYSLPICPRVIERRRQSRVHVPTTAFEIVVYRWYLFSHFDLPLYFSWIPIHTLFIVLRLQSTRTTS